MLGKRGVTVVVKRGCGDEWCYLDEEVGVCWGDFF